MFTVIIKTKEKKKIEMSEAVLVGINGFGRVGRSFLLSSLENPSIRVTAINDPFVSAEYAAYLIKSEARGSAKVKGIDWRADALIIDGCVITVTQKSDASSIPWGDSRVVYVVECSGVNTTHDRAGAHLAGGASRVVITAPSSDAQTVVCGANFEAFKSSSQVIAAGSCTGVAIAPVLRHLNEKFGIDDCSFTVIHALTSQQKIVDGTNSKDWRGARSGLSNIIPFACGALKTIQKCLPAVAVKLIGTSFRVPVLNGCAVDMTFRFANPTSKEAIDSAIRDAASGALGKFIEFSDDEIVSGDIGFTSAAVYDSRASLSLNATTHKLVFWFSHEHGYAERLVDLILRTNATW